MLEYIAEFLGTFILTFSFLLYRDSNVGIFAKGITLMCSLFLFSNFSSGTFNPAILFVDFFEKMNNYKKILFYMISQFLASYIAYEAKQQYNILNINEIKDYESQLD